MSERAEFIRHEIRHINYLKSRACADVRHGKRNAYTFHEVFIEGIRFRGGFSWDGLVVESGGVCELGELAEITTSTRNEQEAGQWWVCRGSSSESRIDLRSLSIGGLHALGYEFGISVTPAIDQCRAWEAQGRRLFQPTWYTFYLSPAFQGLVQWAKEHPRKVLDLDLSEATPCNWKRAAMNGRFDWRLIG